MLTGFMRYPIRSDPSQRVHSEPRPSRAAEDDARRDRRAHAERAVLVGVLLPSTRADFNDPLGELAALAAAAGVEVVDSLVQKRMNLTPACGIGKGKVSELAARVDASQAEVVIFDNELTPRQIRGLEKAVSRKVIDRSELILDIFASRAMTREAQLQVELAQLEYTAPRLRGMWSHLERIAGAGGATSAGVVGGVGTRGPGERQIEIDRRIVKDRIALLKREIHKIDLRKQREVRSRRDQFTVSLVGYTNSGKSTLMNRLTRAGRYAADQLFATLDTKTVRWDLGDGRSALLSDTVGFIRELPHHLVASFRATLEEAIHADLLLHVVDVSSPVAWQQVESVDEVLGSIGCGEIPQVTLLNKIDIAHDTSMTEMLASHRRETLCVSALTGEGLDNLEECVRQHILGGSTEVTVRIPHAEGKLAGELSRLSEVLERRYLSEALELRVRIPRRQLAQLQGRYPALAVVPGGPEVHQDSGRAGPTGEYHAPGEATAGRRTDSSVKNPTDVQ